MQKVAIVTDGSSDLPKEIVEKYGITIAPFQVIIGDKSYKMYGDYGELSKEEFYNILKTSKVYPTTAIPTPKGFHQAFEAALKIGKAVIGIFISEKLSGTYQSAMRVANQLFTEKDITLIDSKVAASTLGILVMEAAKLAKEGKTKEEILERIHTLLPHGRLISVMDNLEAAYRSGRLSWTKKFLVSTFKIRPVTLFENGAIVPGGRIKGEREEVIKRMKFVGPQLLKHSLTNTIFIWHVQYPEAAQQLKEEMEKHNTDGKEIIIQEAGPVVGTHVGMYSLAYMYYGDYNSDWILNMKA
ncbi:MAG: DegV family protein [Candidatus Heimdallarchaeota archaeon]|nr:DegV family protein [Candidatus Heimdallarchaeota archaeon]